MIFFKQLKLQCRVISALAIREIYTRFGREGIGFVWIVAEPLLFAIPVLTLWSIVRPKYEHGIPMMAILISGYMAIMLFRHVGGAMMLFIRANATLLYHQPVTIMDIFWARCVLEILSNLAALLVVYAIFLSLGEVNLPTDVPMFFLGYFYMIWWCICVGLLVGAFTERSRLIEKIWPVYAYTYLFFSGFFYLADWLPPTIRHIALLQPSLQSYEMIRAGMLGNTIKTYGDPVYTTLVLAVLTLFGLWALREGRKHIVLY